ncbi:lytic murein transglycosylase [Lysinibacter cavernae]|nr:lytic murein transglycosylase [Lysinibacter cavernae]
MLGLTREGKPTVRGIAVIGGAFAVASLIGVGLMLVPQPVPEPVTGAVGSNVPQHSAAETHGNPTTTATPPKISRPGDAPVPLSELVDAGWVSAVSAGTGIPERALTAYAGAALVTAQRMPSCGIGWNTLAGLGLIESGHGTIAKGAIYPDGVARPDIIGIPLNGDGVLAMRDTDGGRIDGDPEWDRAVGPMQFIPQTWAEWGVDGNADGVADPHNIDDAALAAAAYLCAVGGDLTQQANWESAIAGYNPSHDYVVDVSQAAAQYASAVGG